jgi:hypothetical protein
VQEGNKSKCESYWPKSDSNDDQMQLLSVRNIQQQQHGSDFETILLEVTEREQHESMTVQF